MLRASDSNDPERVQQPKDPESGNPSPEQGGVVKELDKEESKRQETEELKKSIPVQHPEKQGRYLRTNPTISKLKRKCHEVAEAE
ncbi:hypothetical protein LENED_012259 [Lentinula edodes]|uniref:Uncharacterized protein n=1 Tax=Lentinula edodes TaxID=5353 RepID=A0A1Q3ESD5_LENED|nr:hypothetical protein LENED_012259 [Lentinula edodes]